LGCFDWDPFAARTIENIVMVKQDAGRMLDELFEIIRSPDYGSVETIMVPTILAQ